MGNLGQTLFGGEKKSSVEKSNSYNEAYPYLKDAYGGQVSTGTDATSFLSKLLGMGGSDAAHGAFDDYKKSAGYDFALKSGSDAITGNAASRGLLSSGSTAKALSRYGQDVGSTYFNNYLDKLMGLSGQGLTAGGLIGSAGQKSESTGTSKGSSKPGLGGFLGRIGSGIAASDPRLKHDVKLVGHLPSGLNVYEFKYIHDDVVHTGVMANEVSPEFLGPEIEGFMTVDYDKLNAYERSLVSEAAELQPPLGEEKG